ncbi:hypothetical protein BZZ01_27655 [Nostocales cyanobacterium HT-58-2]|nr:hypothetical protein BZZ01_27655 [Nostocales cyanobacterium HT-58-2]
MIDKVNLTGADLSNAVLKKAVHIY